MVSMKLGWKVSIFFALLTLYSTARGQALSETTDLLTSPAARQKLTLTDPNAKKAEAGVESLGLSAAGEARVYELSAKIFEKLTHQAGGDSEKLGIKLQDFLRDPAALGAELTDAQKTEIHELSSEIKWTAGGDEL